MTRRKKRYDPDAADAYIRQIQLRMELANFFDFREIHLRRCGEYHYQFWLGRRCLMNVWPSHERYQLTETNEGSVAGPPSQLVAALAQAAARAKPKREPPSINRRVTRAITCLSQYLLKQDETLIHDASELIQGVENEFFGRGRQQDTRSNYDSFSQAEGIEDADFDEEREED